MYRTARDCCCEYTCSALSSSVTLSGGSEQTHKHNKQQHCATVLLLKRLLCVDGYHRREYVTVVEGKERESEMDRDGGSSDFRQQLLGFNFARETGNGEEEEEGDEEEERRRRVEVEVAM